MTEPTAQEELIEKWAREIESSASDMALNYEIVKARMTNENPNRNREDRTGG